MSRVANGKIRKPYERPVRPRASEGMWQHDKAPGAIPSAVVNTNGNGHVHPAAVNTKLVVSNLHYNVTAKDLVSIFGQIGTLVREPHIKYDRSGRSTGIAFLTYETPTEATRAKKQFEGILAKGQPMSIAYDSGPPTRPRRASAPTSLVDRIQKKPLYDRIAGNAMGSSSSRPVSNGGGSGPIRSRPRGRAPTGPASSFKKVVKTAEELDKELDAFMGEDSEKTTSSAVLDGDVDMA